MPRKYIRKIGGRPRAEWTQENLTKALDEITKGTIGITDISRKYGIPSTTLRRRYANKNIEKKTLGKHPLLDFDNEKRLVAHIKTLVDAGSPPSGDMVRRLAFDFAEKLGIETPFNKVTRKAGPNWLRSFLERHSELRTCQLKSLSVVKTRGINWEEVSSSPGPSSNKPPLKKCPRVQAAFKSDDESDDQSQSVSGVSSDEEVQQYSDEKTTEFPTGYKCNACEEDILGFRYTCVQCVSYNLCVHCEALREHADHYMLRIPSGKCNTETERVLDRIRLNLNIIQQPKKEPEDYNEKSCIIMEALEIKQDPLPYTYPAEDVHNMMVPDPVPGQLLKPKKCYTRTVPKRKQATKEDNTELQPKASRISQSTVDESISDTEYGDNKKIKIEIKEEPIDSEPDNSSASSQVAAPSSSSVVPVSYTEVPRVKLEPNEIEVTDIKGFNPSPL